MDPGRSGAALEGSGDATIVDSQSLAVDAFELATGLLEELGRGNAGMVEAALAECKLAERAVLETMMGLAVGMPLRCSRLVGGLSDKGTIQMWLWPLLVEEAHLSGRTRARHLDISTLTGEAMRRCGFIGRGEDAIFLPMLVGLHDGPRTPSDALALFEASVRAAQMPGMTSLPRAKITDADRSLGFWHEINGQRIYPVFMVMLYRRGLAEADPAGCSNGLPSTLARMMGAAGAPLRQSDQTDAAGIDMFVDEVLAPMLTANSLAMRCLWGIQAPDCTAREVDLWAPTMEREVLAMAVKEAFDMNGARGIDVWASLHESASGSQRKPGVAQWLRFTLASSTRALVHAQIAFDIKVFESTHDAYAVIDETLRGYSSISGQVRTLSVDSEIQSRCECECGAPRYPGPFRGADYYAGQPRCDHLANRVLH